MSNSRRTDQRVSQIISTQKRTEILNVILLQKEGFTITQILDVLKAKEIQLKRTTVLNVVKALHYSGFLSEEPEQKITKRTGRAKYLYKLME